MTAACEHGNEVYIGDRFPQGQTPYCFLCWRTGHPTALFAKSPPRPIPLPITHCIHRGDSAPAGVIAAAGFDPNRVHYQCNSGYGIVTDCKTCGSGRKKAPACNIECNGYVSSQMIFDQGASGIGDGLQGLLAVNGFKDANPNASVAYRVSDSARPFVELFHGYDSLGKHHKGHSSQPVVGSKQLNVGYEQEWSSKFSGGGRWERYCRNAGGVHPVIPELRDPDRVKAFGVDYAGRVVLCPFSHSAARTWPISRWLDLEQRLIGDGWKTIVMHTSVQERGYNLHDFKGMIAVGLPAERVAGIMLNSRLVIGNDSGMAHLAGILGVPTLVVMSGQPGQKIYGCYPKVKIVQG